MPDDDKYLWDIGKRIQERHPGAYDKYSKHDIGEAVRKNNPHLFEDFKSAIDLDMNPPSQRFSDYFGNLWKTINPLPAAGLAGKVIGAAGRTAIGLKQDDQYNEQLRRELFQSFVQPQVDEYNKARQEWNRGNYTEAIGRGAAAALPGVGPAAAHAGEQIGSGDIAGGLGTATGILLPFAASKVVPKIKVGPQESLYRSSLRFDQGVSQELRHEVAQRGLGRPVSESHMKTGSGRTVPAAEAMPIREKSLPKILEREKAGKAKVTGKVQQATQAGASIPVDDVLAPIKRMASRFTNSANPARAKALRRLVEDFDKRFGQGSYITPEIAQKLKENTDEIMSDKAFAEGQKGSMVTRGEKAIRTGLQKEIEKVDPEIHNLNRSIKLDIELRKAINSAVKYHPAFWKTATTWLLGLGGAAAIELAQGRYAGYGTIALTGALIRAALGNPSRMAQLALMLEKAGVTTDEIARLSKYSGVATGGPNQNAKTAEPEKPAKLDLDQFLK